MRICPQCKSEMKENLGIRVDGSAYGINISDSNKVFAKKISKPKVALCMNCGEISMYIDDISELKNNKNI